MIIYFLISLIISLIIGYIVVSLFSKKDLRQTVSSYVGIRHLQKNGTPTMGGVIFLFSFLIVISYCIITDTIYLNSKINIIIISVIMYALLGFIDDYAKIKYHNNKGLSIKSKFLLELFFALIIYLFYRIYINNNIISIGSLNVNLKYFYGIFIFLYFVVITNAVNITDGLDGLVGSLSSIILIFIGFSIYQLNNDISLLSIVFSGTIIGFLFYNLYPAKIFMGDLGSLSIGAFFAIIGILTKKEIMILLLLSIFLFELFSSFIQVISIKCCNKKIFLKAPFHHHLEQKNFSEITIVKVFFYVNLIINILVLVIEYYN